MHLEPWESQMYTKHCMLLTTHTNNEMYLTVSFLQQWKCIDIVILTWFYMKKLFAYNSVRMSHIGNTGMVDEADLGIQSSTWHGWQVELEAIGQLDGNHLHGLLQADIKYFAEHFAHSHHGFRTGWLLQLQMVSQNILETMSIKRTKLSLTYQRFLWLLWACIISLIHHREQQLLIDLLSHLQV